MQNSLEKFQTPVTAGFVHNLTNSKFDALIQKYSHKNGEPLYTQTSNKKTKQKSKTNNTHTHKTRYPLECFEAGENISDCKTGVSPPLGIIKNGES